MSLGTTRDSHSVQLSCLTDHQWCGHSPYKGVSVLTEWLVTKLTPLGTNQKCPE